MIKYAQQYLRSAVAVIAQYDGVLPLSAFLKQYFKANPKFGSKDRKNISHLCYTFFRAGNGVNTSSVEEKIKASVFICETNADDWGLLVDEQWRNNWNADIETKWRFVASVFPGSGPANLFPWNQELSSGIDAVPFAVSHLVQPDLFLRIRPERSRKVFEKLSAAKIPFRQVSGNCLALPNASKIDEVLNTDTEVVIQDLSSQRVGDVLKLCIDDSKITKTVWDCCAASGGKSILAFDLIKNIQLTVSDVRASILRNLQDRFERAGIKNYHSFVADLAGELKVPPTSYRIVICDAPCSGSGTWGRTPEQLHFFTKDKIDSYSALQKKITTNVIPYIEENGYFLYITCSVFKKENEEIVCHILESKKLELVRSELLKGYEEKADSMFVALFRRSNT